MPPVTKPELRKTIRERLVTLSFEARAEKSAAICRAVSQTPEWQQARTVGFFSPLPEEPDVNLLWTMPGERVVCYPRVDGEHLLFLRVPNRETLVESGRWNLLEPLHSDEFLVLPLEIDLFLIPGVAFTTDGHRMGRGKGFYDRLLSRTGLRAALFGICFAEQLVSGLPREPHDRPVDRVFAA